MKILLVDDMALNREVIGKMLETSGHQVTPADGGEEAVAAVAAGEFDLVLMDVRMPGMDGIEATRQIRAMPGVRGLVPIVATSAQPFVEAEIRDAGADGFIARKFSLDELIVAIRDGVAVARERDTAKAVDVPAAERTGRMIRDDPPERRVPRPATDDPNPPRIYVDRRTGQPAVAVVAPTPEPTASPVALITKWWPVLGIAGTLFSAVVGGLSVRAFTAGANSVREETADRERAALTTRVDELKVTVNANADAERNQGYTNRRVDDALKELAEHVHELDGRATALTSRADLADGRTSVLGDRLQQQPPPLGARNR